MAYEEDKTVLHDEFKSYNEIVEAVKSGKKVHWANTAYDVEHWEKQDWIMVTCNINNHSIGLGQTEYDIVRCFTV